MIEITLLKDYGAVKKELAQNEFLFRENEPAFFFYQIISGSVKMNNYNDDGQETIQGVFNENKSFGEPPLFGNFNYPANAVAVKKTELIALEKSLFIKLLSDNFDISLKLMATLSNRIRFKALLSKEIKGYDAAHKIETLLHLVKNKETETEIDITRQTIANLLGLRVETVIKTIKKLEKMGKLKIVNRKIVI